MTEGHPDTVSAAIGAGCDQAGQLADLLEAEYRALGAQDLSAFEQIQFAKQEIIGHLGSLIGLLAEREQSGDVLDGDQSAHWVTFRSLIGRCREQHRRNGVIVRTRLSAINATLRLLGPGDEGLGMDLYDRLGRVGGPGRGRAYSDA